jgi:hypothetical protein
MKLTANWLRRSYHTLTLVVACTSAVGSCASLARADLVTFGFDAMLVSDRGPRTLRCTWGNAFLAAIRLN